MFSLPRNPRQSSELITIKYSGYLLKRSNEPFQNPSITQDAFALPLLQDSTDENCSGCDDSVHLPQHVDIPELNAKDSEFDLIQQKSESDISSGIDVALSLASDFFGLSADLKAMIKNKHDHDKSDYSRINLQPHESEFKENSLSMLENPLSSFVQRTNSSILPSASPRINIPRRNVSPPNSNISASPKSYTEEPEKIYRSISSPISYGPDTRTGDSSKIPHNIIDPMDGHIWRTKYCVLENGILYFYRNEADANAPKAKSERTDNTLFHRPQLQISSPQPSYLRNTSIDSLSTSPIPRNPLMNKPNSIFSHEGDVMWEKKVALDSVGAVRSAEDEHGKFSFVLLTSAECNSLEEQDCLVLRSNSTKEMQEWLFQIHRSLASIVKEIVFQHPSGNLLLPPEVHYPLVGISPRFTSMDKKVILNSNQTSASYSPKLIQGAMNTLHSLSHGHGRNDMHRRRVREKGCSATRSRTSSIDSQRTDPLVAWETDSTDAPFDLVDENISPLVLEPSKTFIHPDTDLNSSQHSTASQTQKSLSPTKPIVTAGKYVPPHLRKKQLSGKYIPPHLRNKPLKSISPAPLASNKNSKEDIINGDDEKKENNPILPDSIDFNRNENVKSKSKPSPIQSVSPHFKLGGCADKDLGSGSIMDAIYKKRSVKLGKGRTETYGFTRNYDALSKNSNGVEEIADAKEIPLGWEVGAVSACGVRSSNEDAYLIANDLFHILGSDEKIDEHKVEKSIDASSPGLFAVFDGHCGFQTARFAAEKLASYLNDSIVNLSPAMEATNIGDFFSDGNLITEVLYSAISALDEDFCTKAGTDGREWCDAGATALVTVISKETLYVANLGDCRGILCCSHDVEESDESNIKQPVSESEGWSMLEEDKNIDVSPRNQRTFWKEVTDIHSPSRQDEKERIEAANGWTTTEQEICFGQIQRMDLEDKDALDILKRWFSHRFKEFDDEQPEEIDGKKKKFKAAPGRLLEIYRICGELGVSRALGDKDFKSAFNSPPDRAISGVNSTQESGEWWEGPNYLPYPQAHNGCFRGDLVSSTPEFQVLKIGKEGVSNEFLILACDGLWDVMDPDDAARIARDLMYDKGWSAESSVSNTTDGMIGTLFFFLENLTYLFQIE